MTTRIRDIQFPGALGSTLAATLELPEGQPRGFALFAHCFTCSSQTHATSAVSSALARHGYAVLRFDFTGLGSSGGDFAETTFTSNIDDIVAAADWLGANWAQPTLLIGHSLGGAAVVAAAARLPAVLAVATIGAPANPDHVRHVFSGTSAPDNHRVAVDIGGRPFLIGRDFLDDIAAQPQAQRLADLRRALLVLHSPTDTVVGIDNARLIFESARHPKSFISIDGADHLLSGRRDAEYAAALIATWAQRYLPPAADAPSEGPAQVSVSEADTHGYEHMASNGRHQWTLDEPPAVGGQDRGPNPYDSVLAALGACTSMTMRMYARRKGWDYGSTTVVLRHRRIHAADCASCDTDIGMVDQIERDIILDPALSPEQRAALLGIADKCPVHRTLTNEVQILTRAVRDEDHGADTEGPHDPAQTRPEGD